MRKISTLVTKIIAVAMVFTGFAMVSAAQADKIKLHGDITGSDKIVLLRQTRNII